MIPPLFEIKFSIIRFNYVKIIIYNEKNKFNVVNEKWKVATKLSVNSLQAIIDRTIEAVKQSREEIFRIGEQSRQEFITLKEELRQVRIKVAEIIDKSDRLELHAKFARNRLAEVSKNFDKYSNEEIKRAYENASEYQVHLAVMRQEEKQLRDRRDQLERRLLKIKDTVERSEALGTQMSVVHNFLAGDLRHIGDVVEKAKEKQQFSLKIIEAQEEERKRLSREIHDGPAQMLANVLLRSEIIERTYKDKGVEEALEEIRDLRKMVKSSLAEVRRIIYDLRPMALDDLGLIPALEKYLKNFAEHANLSIVFKNLGREQRLSSQLEVVCFRLVQEAVQNVHKHAKANEVQVKMEIKLKNIFIIIKDDGIGFDVNEKKDGSLGLIGMRERVTMLKGSMEINSAKNMGTTIIIDIPIE